MRACSCCATGSRSPPAQVICARLDPWPATQPTGAVIGIDVASGRLAVGDGFSGAASIDVEYHYGFPADIGGGPYERRNWLIARRPRRTTRALPGQGRRQRAAADLPVGHRRARPLGVARAPAVQARSSRSSTAAATRCPPRSSCPTAAGSRSRPSPGQRPLLTTGRAGSASTPTAPRPTPTQRAHADAVGRRRRGLRPRHRRPRRRADHPLDDRPRTLDRRGDRAEHRPEHRDRRRRSGRRGDQRAPRAPARLVGHRADRPVRKPAARLQVLDSIVDGLGGAAISRRPAAATPRR